MSRVPLNYRKILKDLQLMRNFFLKPAGLDIPSFGPPPKKTPVVKFVRDYFVLQRPNKWVDDSTLAFRTNQEVSKPEIRQYFEKLYGLKIKQVNTVRFMGKVYRTSQGGFKKTAASKKVYLKLQDKVDPFLVKTE